MESYVCYYLYFDNPKEGYVGISKDFKARLRQHRSEHDHKNAKVRWVRSNLKSGKTMQHEILHEGLTAEEAYQVEKDTIERLRSEGYVLHNSKTSGYYARGSWQPPNAKEYAVIKDGQLLFVKGLVKFCKENGLSHGNLHNALKGKIRHAQGYIVFFKEDWDSLSTTEQETWLDNYAAYISSKSVAPGSHMQCPAVVTEPATGKTFSFDSVKDAVTFIGVSTGSVYKYLKGETTKLLNDKYTISYKI